MKSLKFKKKLSAYIPFTICIALVIALILTLPAYAHRVISYSYVEGDSVVVEGAFDDGSPTKKAKVKVYNSSGKVINKGKTNAQGIYKFEVSKKDDLKIVLEAGMGHKAESNIKQEDLPEVANSSTQQQTKDNSKQSSIQESTTTTGISEDKLRSLIREELSKELSEKLPQEIAPIKRSLIQLKNKKGPGVTEILGGIGYIFGLMGIAFYFKAKRSEVA
ncbi:hypothetical protein [Acetohalobium arabaticum]|uniref:Nickel transport protein n=1 Tax=Acetohalobium arabaticum (strain ATCC 49924 / DSM 5501 / Z-7288) TaxID=574087 RepID=D9QVQ8_ACEAZ|nr:hypothetical protein [Acetohalobium arabaticum]ADL12317.1 conserved hypothetical protein [Acetohalobium arabaticum DSM 5501]